ncbi:MAG: DUF3237 domain-containing protein [Gammaproteobacteria bacterium]
MKLEHLMDYHLDLGDALDVGAGPHGKRLIVETTGGSFRGARLAGRIRAAGGADWLTMCDDFAHMDVRATLETDDGALIYAQYTGRSELAPSTLAALAGEGETEYGQNEMFTSWSFQTGAAPYRWLNNLICVGEGRLKPGRVEYRVYALRNG